MPHSLFAFSGLALLIAVATAAAVVGGLRERIGAAVVVIAAALSFMFDGALGAAWIVPPLLAIDTAVLAAFIMLSWRAPHAWPAAATACQATAVAVHLLRLVSPHQDPWVYLTALGLTSDAALLCLAWGVWRAWRERKGLKS